MSLTLSLLEFLQYKVGCDYLSDLRHMDAWQKTAALHALRQVPAGAGSLGDWNDALDYLAQVPPVSTAQEAKGRLMSELSKSVNTC